MTPRQWLFYLESVPFTADAIEGRTSLGGSESAAIGMMRALAARGHDVQCYAQRLEAPGEYDGVMWHPAADLGAALGYLTPDVFVALRLPTPYVQYRVTAHLCVLWCEDLMVDPGIVSTLAQVDQIWYVSDYHRKQWEGRDALVKPLGWVTRNGIDPTLYPSSVSVTGAQWADGGSVTRNPHRFIYVSRPERALKPLLALWPRIKQMDPDAVLGICRYRSMYDGEGTQVQAMVDSFDRATAGVSEVVGGIEWLGNLGKRQLAEAIASSRAMLYPGIADFAETSCIAALEAQACGTPMIGSWRGALPETLHPDAGILVEGDPEQPDYQAAFLGALDGIMRASDSRYAMWQSAGRAHVRGYSFDGIAADWERHVEATFAARYASNQPQILRNLLHWDRHVMARDVAAELGDDGALKLCETVIAGQHQTANGYAAHANPNPQAEADSNERFAAIVEAVESAKHRPMTILDVACGNGSLILRMAKAFPAALLTGVDYSPGVLAMARAAVEQAGLSARVTFVEAGWQDIPAGPFDLVTCGEFIEHVEDPAALINRLEAACSPAGICVFTCPTGPFCELMAQPEKRARGHLHTYSYQQIQRLLVGRQWTLRHLAIGATQRGSPVGYWVVAWRPNPAAPAQPITYDADIVATRPYQSITAIMIVKDGEDWLRKCLRSFALTVDEILIHDTGSTDGSIALAESLGAIVRQHGWPDSFAVARNRVLREAEERGADWVLWIDCDETVEMPYRIRRYTTGAGPFMGYVLKQQHLMLDAPSFHDKPVRLFRAGHGVRFYGAVHEQPETAPDAGIWPSLELPDCDILHLGYHRDEQRRHKLLSRNLPLLKKQLAAPDGEKRRLDFVLFIRDCANIAQFEVEAHGGLTEKAQGHARAGAAMWRKHLSDPADKYHELARPFYDQCLALLGAGFEVGYAIAGGAPKVQGKLAPASFRALTVAEAERELAAKAHAILTKLEPPPIDTLPSVIRHGHRLVESR